MPVLAGGVTAAVYVTLLPIGDGLSDDESDVVVGACTPSMLLPQCEPGVPVRWSSASKLPNSQAMLPKPKSWKTMGSALVPKKNALPVLGSLGDGYVDVPPSG